MGRLPREARTHTCTAPSTCTLRCSSGCLRLYSSANSRAACPRVGHARGRFRSVYASVARCSGFPTLQSQATRQKADLFNPRTSGAGHIEPSDAASVLPAVSCQVPVILEAWAAWGRGTCTWSRICFTGSRFAASSSSTSGLSSQPETSVTPCRIVSTSCMRARFASCITPPSAGAPGFGAGSGAGSGAAGSGDAACAARHAAFYRRAAV